MSSPQRRRARRMRGVDLDSALAAAASPASAAAASPASAAAASSGDTPLSLSALDGLDGLASTGLTPTGPTPPTTGSSFGRAVSNLLSQPTPPPTNGTTTAVSHAEVSQAAGVVPSYGMVPSYGTTTDASEGVPPDPMTLMPDTVITAWEKHHWIRQVLGKPDIKRNVESFNAFSTIKYCTRMTAPITMHNLTPSGDFDDKEATVVFLQRIVSKEDRNSYEIGAWKYTTLPYGGIRYDRLCRAAFVNRSSKGYKLGRRVLYNSELKKKVKYWSVSFKVRDVEMTAYIYIHPESDERTRGDFEKMAMRMVGINASVQKKRKKRKRKRKRK